MSVADYFDDLAKFGRVCWAADAGSAQSLGRRWAVMLEGIPTRCRTVLDVGCGFGGFGDYLAFYRPDVPSYAGIDISAKQVALARGAGHVATHADVLDMEGAFDVVVAQGVFYKQRDYEACDAILQKMWDLSTRVVVVTTILTGGDGELSFELRDLLAMVNRTSCRSWTIRHDYHPNDMCLYLYKGAP